jgi:putative Mg2+ transporter-C (MgtC) family protein
MDWHSFAHEIERILVAYLLTVLIGWDREQEEHSAGLRTFPIVGIASCGYLMIVGGEDTAAQSRVLQGLITGIGFIGGGAILKEGLNVKGMATAAIVLAVMNLITLRGLLRLKNRLDKR